MTSVASKNEPEPATMYQLTQEEVTGWLAGFGWSASLVELEPDDEEQWVLEVPGNASRYNSFVAWYASPDNLLVVRVNLRLNDDSSTRFGNLNVADRMAFLSNLRLSIARHHQAVDYQIQTTPDDDEAAIPIPETAIVIAHIPVDQTFSRNDFWVAFRRVQSAMTDVDILFQRLALGRMLP